MMWETNVDKPKFLSADERILLALYLINQEKSISWLAGWLAPDYNGKNVYSTLSRLAKRLTASRSNLYEVKVRPYISIGKYQITQLGISWLERRFPLVIREGSDPSLPAEASAKAGVHAGGSDPSLTAAIIDAAEIKGRRRKLIFDELKRWQYGRLSRGIYLTGSAQAQTALVGFVNRYRLAGYVNLMAIIPAQDSKILADRVFRLTDRNAAWRLLIDRMFEWNRSEGLSLAPAKVRPYSRPQNGLRRIRNDFLHLLVTEPGLPPQLKPQNYFMNSAVKTITGDF